MKKKKMLQNETGKQKGGRGKEFEILMSTTAMIGLLGYTM
jgi:hypothetical protein